MEFVLEDNVVVHSQHDRLTCSNDFMDCITVQQRVADLGLSIGRSAHAWTLMQQPNGILQQTKIISLTKTCSIKGASAGLSLP